MPDAVSSSTLMPPAPMRIRVAGTDNPEWFHVSGRITCEIYESALASVGRHLADFHDVLDFGCGVGRVLRWLQPLLPDAHFSGSESDEAAIEWIRENYPNVETATTSKNGLPPLRFADASFDLVVGYSIFTHLNAEYQDAWLAELQRLVRPGGILLLSISGPRMLEYTLTKSDHSDLADLRNRAATFATDGILHWLGDGWETLFPAYYHTTFHAHQYIRDHWSRWFTVLAIDANTPDVMPQDIVILLRNQSQPARASTPGATGFQRLLGWFRGRGE
jgi:SAM-dependent methyltransferase